jgi:prevent-host-death family protein
LEKFPFSKLKRASTAILEAARHGSVELTYRGRGQYVLMSIEHYGRLTGDNKTRHLNIYTMSDEDREMLLKGLSRFDDDHL